MTTTSLEVGSVFTIIDRASPVIDRLARQLGDFAKLVAKTKEDLATLGSGKPFAGLETNLKAATEQLVKLSGRLFN